MTRQIEGETGTSEEPVLVVAPGGRDATVICSMLSQSGVHCEESGNLGDLIRNFHATRFAAAIIVQEAFIGVDFDQLGQAISQQQPWSDFPFIVLTQRGGISPQFHPIVALLGNITILERPLHPVTLVSAARSALRARSRQRQARDYLRERERAEAALRDLAETLEHRIAERTLQLSAANDRLTAEIGERERTEARLIQSQKMEAIGQLTGGVAHDFNNLLFAVIGNLEMLTRRTHDPKMLRMINNALQAAERGSKLTTQLLAFSRRQRLVPEPVDVNRLVSAMGDLLVRTIGSTVQIKSVLGRDAWHALVDPTQLEMVVLNLAINARDAMPSGGEILIQTSNVETLPEALRDELSADGLYLLISVSDTGTGMSPDVVSRVFEPFFTTKPTGKGSGLGLSQVFGFARQSGGAVRIDSEIGKGTTVRVYLPRTEGTAAVSDAIIAPLKPPGKVCILVLDDDRDVREVLVTMLEDLGYTVIASENGTDAIEKIRTAHVDLLLTDVAMPGMNGLEVARAARRQHSDLPVLFATGYADLDSIGASLDEEYVIKKPYRSSELAHRVRKALDGRIAPRREWPQPPSHSPD